MAIVKYYSRDQLENKLLKTKSVLKSRIKEIRNRIDFWENEIQLAEEFATANLVPFLNGSLQAYKTILAELEKDIEMLNNLEFEESNGSWEHQVSSVLLKNQGE